MVDNFYIIGVAVLQKLKAMLQRDMTVQYDRSMHYLHVGYLLMQIHDQLKIYKLFMFSSRPDNKGVCMIYTLPCLHTVI